MKKIPTLFERQYANHRIVGISNKVCPGMEWVFAGDGVATVKIDGSCCAIIDGELYTPRRERNRLPSQSHAVILIL